MTRSTNNPINTYKNVVKIPVDRSLYIAVFRWCKENCQGEYKFVTKVGMVFENEEDAMMFKLIFR